MDGSIIKEKFKGYVSLTKPRIMVLLLVTAMTGLFLGKQGVPSLTLVIAVLIGGAFASGGASSINHYLDKDIDSKMNRTKNRPIPSKRISPAEALLFGLVLTTLGFLVLIYWGNLLSAILAMTGTLFYVFVYTMLLKRNTPQNIVLGGAAGAIPPLVGYAAATGTVSISGIYLFLIIFFWTPPHFWSLALMIKDDYERAGIPMLPVVKGVAHTKRSIFAYTVFLIGLTLGFAWMEGMGWIYFISSLVLGSVFVYYAWDLLRLGTERATKRMYLYSLAYLFLLFAAVMLDALV
jgi:protoheme IX farnesyltransferase